MFSDILEIRTDITYRVNGCILETYSPHIIDKSKNRLKSIYWLGF